MPSNRTFVEVGGAVALLAALAWLHQHDAAIRAQAVNAQIETDRKAAASKAAEQLKEVRVEKEAVKTPEQVVRIINRYVPLPVPVGLQTQDSTLASTLVEKPDAPIPHPFGAKPIVIPQEDAVAFSNYVEDCRACEIKLAASEADNKRVGDERDAAVRALKGGTWLVRLKQNAKYLLIGAAAGAIATRVAH